MIPGDEGRMPLVAHLAELRKRLMICIAGFVVAFAVCFYFSENIFSLLMFPLRGYLVFSIASPHIRYMATPDPPKLYFMGITEAFWMNMKIAMLAGLVLTLPLIFQQVWKFISPGLLLKEKKLASPFVIGGTILFVMGALFCYLIVLPFAIRFLLNYKTQHLTPMLTVGKYMDFCLKFIMAFGIVFELPMFIILLVRMGIVSADTLAKNRKYAILGAVIAAAILTPSPDAFNQILMAIPMVLLYEVGILLARILIRRPAGIG